MLERYTQSVVHVRSQITINFPSVSLPLCMYSSYNFLLVTSHSVRERTHGIQRMCYTHEFTFVHFCLRLPLVFLFLTLFFFYRLLRARLAYLFNRTRKIKLPRTLFYVSVGVSPWTNFREGEPLPLFQSWESITCQQLLNRTLDYYRL